MKLMLLIIPMIQTIVNPIANGPVEGDVPGAERVVDEGHGDPGHDREGGQRDLAEQLPAGAELERVVEDAEDRRHGAADEQAEQLRARRSCAGSSRAASRSLAIRIPIATTMNAVATAMPPPRGIGRLLTRR